MEDEEVNVTSSSDDEEEETNKKERKPEGGKTKEGEEGYESSPSVDFWEPNWLDNSFVRGDLGTLFCAEYIHNLEFDAYEMHENIQGWCSDREMEEQARKYIDSFKFLYKREIEILAIYETVGDMYRKVLVGYCFFKFEKAKELYESLKGPLMGVRELTSKEKFSVTGERSRWENIIINCLLDPHIRADDKKKYDIYLRDFIRDNSKGLSPVLNNLPELIDELISIKEKMLMQRKKYDGTIIAEILLFCSRPGHNVDDIRTTAILYLEQAIYKMLLLHRKSFYGSCIKARLDSTSESYWDDVEFYNEHGFKGVGETEKPEELVMKLHSSVNMRMPDPDRVFIGPDYPWIKRKHEFSEFDVEYINYNRAMEMVTSRGDESLDYLAEFCEDKDSKGNDYDHLVSVASWELLRIVRGRSVHDHNLIVVKDKKKNINAAFMAFGFDGNRSKIANITDDFRRRSQLMATMLSEDIALFIKFDQDRRIRYGDEFEQMMLVNLAYGFATSVFLPDTKTIIETINKWLRDHPIFYMYDEHILKLAELVRKRNNDLVYYKPKKDVQGMFSHVYLLCVKEEYRKKGLVRKMLNYVARTTRDFATFLGASGAYIKLEPSGHNEKLHSYYANLGFESSNDGGRTLFSFDLMKEYNREFDSGKSMITSKIGKSHFTGEYEPHYIVQQDGMSWIIKSDKSRHCEHSVTEEEMTNWLVNQRDPGRDNLCLLCQMNKLNI